MKVLLMISNYTLDNSGDTIYLFTILFRINGSMPNNIRECNNKQLGKLYWVFKVLYSISVGRTWCVFT